MKFTIIDNLDRKVEYLNGILIESIDGYNLLEDDKDLDKAVIYFEDINRNGEIMKRYFDIKQNEVTDFKNIYNLYRNNYTKKFSKLLELSKFSNKENCYNDNKLFFYACNISLREWEKWIN